METNKLIFVGFELTQEMRDQFANCQSRDRAYLEDSAYLETVEIDGTSYVGKRADSSIAIDRIEDIARSVVSLLHRVCKEWSFGPEQALVIGAEEEDSVPISEDKSGPGGFDYSGLVD